MRQCTGNRYATTTAKAMPDTLPQITAAMLDGAGADPKN
jgi:hypothetical protein